MKVDTILLPISEITINPDVNIRELDPNHIADLADAQKDYGETEWQKHWKELPKINDENILFSGFHTVTAAQRNFGESHEIGFLVIEGNPYLLAACENASHGKRRTNADKRAAVLRWLEDDEGKTWSDSHIAKMCHVSNQMVRDVALSLGESPSDNYQRPTLRKSINKHGDIEEVETANIGRQREKLIEQITANVSAFRNLYVEHYKKGITSLKEMFTAGITEFNLPKEGIAITLENPTGSYTDIKTLQRIQDVTDRLIKDWTGQPKAGWIRKCLQTEDQKKAELWEKIDARLPKWKERLPGVHSKAMFTSFTKDLLIEKFREHAAEHGFERVTPGSPISLRELGELHGYIRDERFGLIYAVRQALLESVVYPDWQIDKAIAAEREMLSVFKETGLDAYMDTDDLAEEITKTYGFPDFHTHREDSDDPLVWIQRFQIITNALKNNAGWVQDLSAEMAEVTAEKQEVAAEEIADSLKIALQKWKEKRNHLPHLADATVSMVVNAAKRYYDISAKGTIEAERVVTLLGSGVVIFQLYVEKLLEGVDIFKIPNNLSLAGVEAFVGADAEAASTDKIKSSGIKQAKLDHYSAQVKVQSAFFTADLPDLMTDIETVETGLKAQKFFAAVVEHCIPKLRFNIFSRDYFYDTRTDRNTEFSEMYRGRDLTLKEIQEEIKVLEGIVREVEWWAEKSASVCESQTGGNDLRADSLANPDFSVKADEGRVPRWMDAVVKAITPPTEVAKTYGEGTQGEFNTSDNACNPTASMEQIDALWDKITPAIKSWKAERKGEGVSYASKSMFIAATKRFHDISEDIETDSDILHGLLTLLNYETAHPYSRTFTHFVKLQCDGKSLWKAAPPEMPSDKEQIDNLLDEIEAKVNRSTDENADGGEAGKRTVANPMGLMAETHQASPPSDSDIKLTGIIAYFQKEGEPPPNERHLQFGSSTTSHEALERLPLVVRELIKAAIAEKVKE